MGLKENVIIGKLIPAGTGVKSYKELSPQYSSATAAADTDESADADADENKAV